MNKTELIHIAKQPFYIELPAYDILKQYLAGAIALAVTACGGGGDGTATPPPIVGPVTTDLQARTVAARSIDALFAYDNMNSEVSSGGAVAAVGKLVESLEEGVVVCIICDRGDRYLSSGVFGK